MSIKLCTIVCAFACLTSLIGLGSCTSTVMAGFDALDPASTALITQRQSGWGNDDLDFVLYPATNRQGQPVVSLECRRLAGIILIAPISAADSEKLFKLPPAGQISLDLQWVYQFYNWENGWSEYRQAVSGQLICQATDGGWRIAAKPGLELLDFDQASVKLGEKIIRGDQALTIMRNRSARVEAIADWLAKHPLAAFEPKAEAWSKRQSWYVPAFKEGLRDLLVPEISPPNRRPPQWNEQAKQWNFAESINWNRDYSEAVFPANLVEIRQSGTLLRDWEESLPMIYARWRWAESLTILTKGVDIHPLP